MVYTAKRSFRYSCKKILYTYFVTKQTTKALPDGPKQMLKSLHEGSAVPLERLTSMSEPVDPQRRARLFDEHVKSCGHEIVTRVRTVLTEHSSAFLRPCGRFQVVVSDIHWSDQD